MFMRSGGICLVTLFWFFFNVAKKTYCTKNNELMFKKKKKKAVCNNMFKFYITRISLMTFVTSKKQEASL